MTNKIIHIIDHLEKLYGNPRHGNKYNPLNEFLYIILSTKTTQPSFEKTYTAFKNHFPRWPEVLKADVNSIENCILSGGLSNYKARLILMTVEKLKADFGRVSLAPIKHLSDEDMQTYLISLPGVGIKSAKCIMMYSFGREVLPVDTHTFRISKRLGILNSKLNHVDEKTHKDIEKSIPPRKRYSYHVTCVSHGRKVCKDINPKCGICDLSSLCNYCQQLINLREAS